MIFEFFKKARLFLSSLLLAVVLLWAVFSGISLGKQIAQAQILVQTSQAAVTALQFFYKDQTTYPSVLEFQNQNIMLNYLSGFPLTEFVSPSCSQSFVYKRLDSSNFQLSFCLPVAVSGYQAGWNTITGVPAEKAN